MLGWGRFVASSSCCLGAGFGGYIAALRFLSEASPPGAAGWGPAAAPVAVQNKGGAPGCKAGLSRGGKKSRTRASGTHKPFPNPAKSGGRLPAPCLAPLFLHPSLPPSPGGGSAAGPGQEAGERRVRAATEPGWGPRPEAADPRYWKRNIQ